MKTPNPFDRVPVQGSGPWHLSALHLARAKFPGQIQRPGTVEWWEHERAWQAYDRRCHCGQSAERIVERGGFSWGELVEFLGHEPATWEPRS